MKYTLLLISLFIALSLQQQKYFIKKIGQWRQRYPSHMRLIRVPHRNSSWSLFVTEFDGAPWTWSRINEIPEIARAVQNPSRVRSRHIVPSRIFSWANEVRRIPYNVFNADYIYCADGFLVPGHSNGDIYILKIIPGTPHSFARPQPISQRKKEWFYHNALFIDMNGDGRIDVLTARASLENGRENAQGELLWLEHPAEGAESKRWKEHVLIKGPDVSIKNFDFLKVKGQIQVVACEFWNKRVVLYNIQLGSNPRVLWSNIVTKDIGFPYEVRFGDIDNDGRTDLVVTNHQDTPAESGLFVFETPKNNNFRSGVFKKHVIRTGYITRQPGQYEASPGFPFVFYPKVGDKGRPHLMVAGDGTQQAYYYYPIGTRGFEFGGGEFINVGGVVGDIAFEDIDGDGYMELFVPNYHGGQMHYLKFYEKTNEERENEKEIEEFVKII